MFQTKTLVHHASLTIGIQAVRTFASCFSGKTRLEIHTDGSLSAADEELLIAAAAASSMESVIIRPDDRKKILDQRLSSYPASRALVSRGGYMVKLELPMVEEEPFFYFDSDIVWLRPCHGIVPDHCPNVFSTESWSWYYGIRKPWVWIKERIPRRVNSGFYYLGEKFPFDRLEKALSEGLYDPDAETATDQELLAYLYPNSELYHPDDFVRSRRGRIYDLEILPASALHFPGRMWESHLREIEHFQPPSKGSREVRKQHAVPLDVVEISRMKFYRHLEKTPWLRAPLRAYRSFRRHWI